jgi:hypothetical protein
MAPRRLHTKAFFVALIAAAAGAFAACGDSGNPQPNPGFTSSSGTGGGASSTAGPGGGSVGGGGQGGNAGGGGNGNGGGTGGDCSGQSNCYSCTPHDTDQFLNHCTDAQCAPFDNVTRLPLYNGGNLPPVP